MKKKTAFCISALLILSLALTGCGSVSSDSATLETSSWASEQYGYNTAVSDAEESYAASDSDSDTGSDGALAEAKLIYTADMELQTTEFDSAAQAFAELVDEMGGYFEQSSVNNYSNYRSGNYIVRLPNENFDSFCESVGGICQLLYLNRSVEDVSEYYYDTQSRLETQQTKLDRLQALLAQAETMEDIITIESAISETELEIEQLTGELRHYDSLIDYSTVYISIDEVYQLDNVEEPAIGFWARLGAAFRSGCSNFVNGLQSAVIGFAYNWVGWCIFLAVAIGAVTVIVRRARRRRGDAAPGTPRRKRPRGHDQENDAAPQETEEDKKP